MIEPGQIFGRLTVIGPAHRSERGKTLWRFSCVCGNEKFVEPRYVRRGEVTSCGCRQREFQRLNQLRHGLSKSRVWRAWVNMRLRCNNQNTKDYRNYGGRGISVCDRWSVFENFLADMGEPPMPGLSLDRINNDGNYEPGNCRWADCKTQNNNRRNSRSSTR